MAIALNAEIKTRPYIFIGKSALVIAVIVASFLTLASQAEATGSVTLHWDQNVEPDIAGYHLLYGITSGSYTEQIDVGNTTKATVPGLADGGTYFFVETSSAPLASTEFQGVPELYLFSPNHFLLSQSTARPLL